MVEWKRERRGDRERWRKERLNSGKKGGGKNMKEMDGGRKKMKGKLEMEEKIEKENGGEKEAKRKGKLEREKVG